MFSGVMATTRTYGDGCAIARALDLVGERWALLVVRELLLGPKRYTDLRRGLPNASPNVLSERLRELERAGVVRRRKLPPPAGSRVYELTDWGLQLEETVIALGRWGVQAPSEAPVRSADSVVLALRAQVDPGAVQGRYELRVGDDRFRVELADGAITAERGSADRPDAAIEADPDTLDAVLRGRRPLADATIEGDAAAAERLVRLTAAALR
jgi:DNA-binding HxlR family transcriptional regulator